MARHPALVEFLQRLEGMKEGGDPTARLLLEGMHPYECRCATCLEWWLTIGPDYDDGGRPVWGPFTLEEIEQAREAHDDAAAQEGDG